MLLKLQTDCSTMRQVSKQYVVNNRNRNNNNNSNNSHSNSNSNSNSSSNSSGSSSDILSRSGDSSNFNINTSLSDTHFPYWTLNNNHYLAEFTKFNSIKADNRNLANQRFQTINDSLLLKSNEYKLTNDDLLEADNPQRLIMTHNQLQFAKMKQAKLLIAPCVGSFVALDTVKLKKYKINNKR